MIQLEKFKKFLMNRVSCTPQIIEYIENCLSTDDGNIQYSFHKIMIHNWCDTAPELFDVLSEYFGTTIIPVDFNSHHLITTFYTSSLSFVLKVIKLDFMFPHRRNMSNIDILFNDKNSFDCFQEKTTIEEIVSSVVSKRFNEFRELNLSNICKDSAFVEKQIFFYKISLLSQFKILMIRMGKDTKLLDLSNNNLIQIPLDILNFFIKGELIGVNLSHNNLPSIYELQRVISKIEKLWIEGNPLCDEMDVSRYIKQILQKFPRLIELDGVKINNYGIMLPFYKNYMEIQNKKTISIIEKFVSLYFAHYDTKPRNKIDMFYEPNAQLTISTSFTKAEQNVMPAYTMFSRNMLEPKTQMDLKYNRVYKTRDDIVGVLSQLPETIHDTMTFNVDVLKHDNKSLVLVIDGVYKEMNYDYNKANYLQFRRTFIFNIKTVNTTSHYTIAYEMLSVSFATAEQIKNSFQIPIRHLNHLTLIDPDKEEKYMIRKAFSHITHFNKTAAKRRLESNNWDIKRALSELAEDCRNEILNKQTLRKSDLAEMSVGFDGYDEID